MIFFYHLPIYPSIYLSIDLLLGRECSTINKDYLLCKKSDSNPVVCLDKSKEVTNCSNEM